MFTSRRGSQCNSLSIAKIRNAEVGGFGRTAAAHELIRGFPSMEPQFWVNLQSRFDLISAEESLGSRLDEDVSPHIAV